MVVEEAATSGNVIATAKRHGIQAHQIYHWRDRLPGRRAPAGFAAVSIILIRRRRFRHQCRISIVRMAIQLWPPCRRTIGSGFEADPERIAITDAQLDRFAIQRAQDRSDDDAAAHRLAVAPPTPERSIRMPARLGPLGHQHDVYVVGIVRGLKRQAAPADP